MAAVTGCPALAGHDNPRKTRGRERSRPFFLSSLSYHAPLAGRGRRVAPGEGDPPRVECVETAPHPNLLPARGEKGRTAPLLRRLRGLKRRIIRVALGAAAIE